MLQVTYPDLKKLVDEFTVEIEWEEYINSDIPDLKSMVFDLEYRYKEQEYKSFHVFRIGRPYEINNETFVTLAKHLKAGKLDERNPLVTILKDLVNKDGNDILVENDYFLNNYHNLCCLATVLTVIIRDDSVDIKIIEKGVIGW